MKYMDIDCYERGCACASSSRVAGDDAEIVEVVRLVKSQEPVAWMLVDKEWNDACRYFSVPMENAIPLYTAPRELSGEEIDRIITDCGYKIEETVMGKFVDIEGINMYNSLCGFAEALLKKASEK